MYEAAAICSGPSATAANWASRISGQDVRQLAYRVVQGSGHDRADVRGQANDRRRQTHLAVACASTGDTSAALAAYAAAAGIRAMVLLREKDLTAQLVQPLANGATVLAVEGNFDDCMKVVQRLADEEGVYLPTA